MFCIKKQHRLSVAETTSVGVIEDIVTQKGELLLQPYLRFASMEFLGCGMARVGPDARLVYTPSSIVLEHVPQAKSIKNTVYSMESGLHGLQSACGPVCGAERWARRPLRATAKRGDEGRRNYIETHSISFSHGQNSIEEIDASQAARLGRSCLSVARSALSLARSAQAERDNESCFFMRAAGVH
ncbi:hypothetical protein EVAR_13876_1 [Eumeta japonica]|uniref:Uncharacterized protein n=1 Tax=Eumeta variegata TaxID=151549 RepID=A0A4C1U219_EUMVA|nr:hypothetical protein EVAR_13876_1 [Eumeta japonica]